MMKLKKNNKLIKYICGVMGILPILVTLYLYPLIPDKIPIHYWLDGSIDKWGSKDELFIVPVLILLFAFIQPRFLKLNFNHEAEDRLTKLSNYHFLLVLNMLTYSSLYISMNYETCLSNFNLYNFFTCSICFIFAFVGNYLPDCNRSSSISIRIKYTLENEIIWYRLHRFCGFFWFSGSIVFFPMFLFSSGYLLLILSILMISLFLLLPFLYGRYLYNKNLKVQLTKGKNFQHSY